MLLAYTPHTNSANGRAQHFTPPRLHYLTFYTLHTSRLHPQGADRFVVHIIKGERLEVKGYGVLDDRIDV